MVGGFYGNRRRGRSRTISSRRQATIAEGTLPLALFGAAVYGRRIGWPNAPARILQAAAP